MRNLVCAGTLYNFRFIAFRRMQHFLELNQRELTLNEVLMNLKKDSRHMRTEVVALKQGQEDLLRRVANLQLGQEDLLTKMTVLENNQRNIQRKCDYLKKLLVEEGTVRLVGQAMFCK